MFEKKYPKSVILKDCKEVDLRLPDKNDVENLVRFYNSIEMSHRWYLKEDPTDPETIRRWLKNIGENRAFAIIAEYDNEIVASATMLMRPYGARKHVARLRITVRPDFRNKRLGTWMIFDLIKRGMEMGIERVRIDFVVGIEDYAIDAVRKLDFIKEGLLRDYLKDESGHYHDYQIMVKQLHKEWSDF